MQQKTQKQNLINSILSKESFFTPFSSNSCDYLIGIDEKSHEGIFLICTLKGEPGIFGVNEYKHIFDEARKHRIKTPYKVYGAHYIYPTRQVVFKEIH